MYSLYSIRSYEVSDFSRAKCVDETQPTLNRNNGFISKRSRTPYYHGGGVFRGVSWFRVLRVSSKAGEREGRKERSQSWLAGTCRVHTREGIVVMERFRLWEGTVVFGCILMFCQWTWHHLVASTRCVRWWCTCNVPHGREQGCFSLQGALASVASLSTASSGIVLE